MMDLKIILSILHKNLVCIILQVKQNKTIIKGNQKAVKWSNETNFQNCKNYRNTTMQSAKLRYVAKYKVRKMAKSLSPLLLSNVIDADHQNSCLFTNKGHFSPPLWGLMGVLA